MSRTPTQNSFPKLPLSNLIPEEHADNGDQNVVRDRTDDDGAESGTDNRSKPHLKSSIHRQPLELSEEFEHCQNGNDQRRDGCCHPEEAQQHIHLALQFANVGTQAIFTIIAPKDSLDACQSVFSGSQPVIDFRMFVFTHSSDT